MKELFHIKNAAPAPVQQTLSLQIGERHLAFAITNRDGDQLKELLYCTAEEWDPVSLDQVISANPILKDPFYQVYIAYDHPGSLLFPSTGHAREEASAMLDSCKGAPGESVVISEQIPGWQLINVFAVPKNITDWVSRHFAAAKSRHQYSIAIRNNPAAANGCLQVDFRNNDFTVIATSPNRFLLAQAYEYATPEDVIYYLLKITDRFGLSQQEVKLVLTGLIDKGSALYKELFQYFIDVEFREADWQTGEHPAHFFTSLNDLSRCAS